MKRWKTVALVGVGLIGGSIGLALRRRGLVDRVVGIGRRESTLDIAHKCGAVTHATMDLESGVADAELIVVCTPVTCIVDYVRRAAGACPRDALITDVGSTKANIVAQLGGQLDRDVAFVGSHPLAGSERTGPQFARADLFEERVAVITPDERTLPDRAALIAGLWTSLGARVVQMSPAEHDEAVAAISHVPHVVSSALSAATPLEHLSLAASGWLDTTRVSAGSVELWQQILSENRVHVLNSLDKFAKVLDSFRTAIREDDAAKIVELLEAGKKCRDAVGNRHSPGSGSA